MKVADEFVKDFFETVEKLQHDENRVVFRVTLKEASSIAKVFSALQKFKASNGVIEYQFSQATLEQVFQTIVRKSETTTT